MGRLTLIIKSGFAVLGLALLPAQVFGAGTSQAQFLKLGAGARAAALGDAFCSVADDATATYWNPAGLAQIASPQFSLMHNSWLVDTQYEYLAAGLPLRHDALGMAVSMLNHGSFDRYTNSDVKDGTFKASSLAGQMSYAHRLNDGFFVGVSGKYIQEAIDDEKAATFAVDLGTLFKRGRTHFAATAQNFGPGLKMVQEKYALPQTVTIGASRRFWDERIMAGLDISKPRDNDVAFRAGVDYKPVPNISLRGGYNITPGNRLDVDGLTNVTGGFGFSFGPLTLDYAFAPFGELGNAHRVSVLVKMR